MKKLPLSLIFLIIFLTPSLTLGLDGKCIEGDCENGYGTEVWFDGYKYIGNFKRGLPSGHGMEIYSNGEMFVGEFKYGLPQMGTLNFSNGDKYKGNFKYRKFHGQGTYEWSDGKKHVGEFKNGQQHGRGVEGLEGEDGKVGYWLYDMYVGKEKPEELKEK